MIQRDSNRVSAEAKQKRRGVAGVLRVYVNIAIFVRCSFVRQDKNNGEDCTSTFGDFQGIEITATAGSVKRETITSRAEK